MKMNNFFIALALLSSGAYVVGAEPETKTPDSEEPKNQVVGTLTYKRLVPGLWKVYRSQDDLGEWKNPYGLIDFVDAEGKSLGCDINTVQRDHASMTVTATHTATQAASIAQKYAEQKVKDEPALVKNRQLADMIDSNW